jgi:hypothetical protein
MRKAVDFPHPVGKPLGDDNTSDLSHGGAESQAYRPLGDGTAQA